MRRLFLPLVLVAVARAGVVAQPSSPRNAEPRTLRAAEAAAIERTLLEAVRRHPDSFEAQYQLASFLVQQRKLEAALPHLERARAIDPSHYACGHDLALALLELGKLAEARAQIASMMAAHENAELHNLLGNVEERAGNFAGADPEYERAAHMAPTEDHLFDWGNNLLQLRAFEDATRVFTPAIARHPQSARLHVGLGIAQYSRGQYEDAVKSFCQAADLAPADPRPYQFLGEMYGVAPALGEEITRRLARFAKAQPRNAQAQFHYAMSLWKGQPADSPPPNLRQVERLLRRAVTLDVKFAKAFLELGILLSDQQRYTEAIQELRHATRLAPDLAQAHFRLSQAYQRTGETELAAKELELFQRKPDFSGEWKLNRQASTLSPIVAPAAQRGALRIEHHEPTFKAHLTIVLDGKPVESQFELLTDGREVVTTDDRGRRTVSTLRWDEEALVATWRIQGTNTALTISFRYELQDGGRRLRAAEQLRGGGRDQDNVWVFERP